MKTIGIIGCGTMGGGIAHVIASHGYPTIVLEVDERFLTSGLQKIENYLTKSVERGKLTQDEKDNTLQNIKGTVAIKDLSSCDLIIEAAVEDLAAKQDMFKKLDSICAPHTIFATNTSSLTVMEIASVTKRQDKFFGLHFFNPVPLMPLVEVVKTIRTSEEVFKTAWSLIESVKKVPIAAKDSTGFIVNLLLIPYLLDAIRVFGEGVASIEDIDNGMKYGCGHPMGPLMLLDLIGLDVIYNISCIMFDEYKEKKYSAPPLLKQMVLAGYLGKKSGKGFYDYGGKDPKPMKLN